MSPRFQRALKIYSEIGSLSLQKRLDAIERLCGEDGDLRQDVNSLIAMETGPSILDRPPQFSEFEPGDVLAGRFEIIRLVGKGGMGCVYEAFDRLGRTTVALKTVLPQFAAQPEYRRRFRHEINTSKALAHDSICRVYDVEVHPVSEERDWEHLPSESTLFLTMEMLRGVTLAQWIRKHGPFMPAAALPIVEQLVAALDAAHRKGVVHRDLKCGNIMLVPQEGNGFPRAVIMDFGLAHQVNQLDDAAGHAGSSQVTAPHTVVGTPDYMAPEQLCGEATTRTDIYALGLVLYEMLTGQLPLAGKKDNSPVLRRIATRIPPPSALAPAVSKEWDQAILRCLKPNADDRFDSVRDLLRALHGQLPMRRQRLAAVIAAAILVLLAVALVFGPQWWRGDSPLTRDPEANKLYLSAKEAFDQRRSDSKEDLERAITLYDGAIAKDPGFAAAIARRAYAYLWMSRIQRSDKGSWKQNAVFEIKRAEDLAPNLFEVHLMKGSILTDTARDKTELAEPLKELKRAIQMRPNSDEAFKKLSTLYMALGDYRNAMASAEKAASTNPYFFDNFMSVGYVSMTVCSLDKAEEAYLKVTQLAPERPIGWNGLGNVLLYKGQFAQSIDSYRKALEKAETAKPYSNIATAYFYLHSYHDAELAAKKALEINSQSYSLNGNLADIYRAMPNVELAGKYYESAIALASQALASDNKDAGAMASLATYFARSNRPAEARKYLESVQPYINQRPYVAYSAAIVHSLLGEKDAGAKSLAIAVKGCGMSKMAANEPDLATVVSGQATVSLVSARGSQ